jgi:hypothetical protein
MFHKLNDTNRVGTRQAADPTSIAVRYSRTDIRKHFFAVRVAETWNRLDPESGTAKPPSSSKQG